MRQFWITSKGDDKLLIDLMEKTTFGANPSGLGVSIESTTYGIGTDIINIDKSVKYDDLQFDMTFGYDSDPYEKMQEVLVKLNAGGLILNYSMDDYERDDPNKVVYQRDVDFLKAEKGEVDNQTGWLKSTLSLMALSPWYKWVEVAQPGPSSIHDSDTDTDIKDVRYSRIPFSTKNSVHLMKGSTVPIKLHYILPRNLGSDNSWLNLLVESSSGKSYGGVQINLWGSTWNSGILLPTGSAIDICSDYQDMYVKATSQATGHEGSVYDLMNCIDTSTIGFLRVPAGENLVLRLKPDDKFTWNPDTDKLYVKEERVIV